MAVSQENVKDWMRGKKIYTKHLFFIREKSDGECVGSDCLTGQKVVYYYVK